MARLLIVVLAAAAAAAPVAYGAGALPAVTHDTFEAEVMSTDHVWVLEFMSPRCGTCKEMAPVFEKVAAQLSGSFNFGTVNIDDKQGMALAKKVDALKDGIPCIIAFRDASGTPTPVWNGWDVPLPGELENLVLNTLKNSPKDAAGKRLKLPQGNEGPKVGSKAKGTAQEF